MRSAFPDFPVVGTACLACPPATIGLTLCIPANQRAGAWYVKPGHETARAYFKSTDGHIGVHDFNLRRSNLALLPLIQQRKGCAPLPGLSVWGPSQAHAPRNRAGLCSWTPPVAARYPEICLEPMPFSNPRSLQRFPDALSKTVPIWCAVLNRVRILLLPPRPENSEVNLAGWEKDGKLWTLPSAIGRSEHSQIEAKIDEWAERLKVRLSFGDRWVGCRFCADDWLFEAELVL